MMDLIMFLLTNSFLLSFVCCFGNYHYKEFAAKDDFVDYGSTHSTEYMEYNYIFLQDSISKYIPKSKRPIAEEYRLIHEILVDYDKNIRPRYTYSEAVEVSVRFSLQQIYDLDEKRQILTISGWLTAEWRDDFLQWDPRDYGNISSFVITPRKIWTPQLAIGNSAKKMFEDWRHFSVTVRSDGKCRWQPGGNFALSCSLDIIFYPFDSQMCTMELETWFYSTDQVGLNKSLDNLGLETYLKHGEWTILDTLVSNENKIYSDDTEETYPQIFFTIFMKRKYTFHFMYILLPCLMLSFVLLMIFLLPAQCGEKTSLGVSILVAYSVFLLIVADQVPDTSDAVPVMAIYLMYFMMATSLSVVTATAVIKIHYNNSSYMPAKCLIILIFQIMAPCLGLHSIKEWYNMHQMCITHAMLTLNSDIKHASCTSKKENNVSNINGMSLRTTNSTSDTLARTLSIELHTQNTDYIDIELDMDSLGSDRHQRLHEPPSTIKAPTIEKQNIQNECCRLTDIEHMKETWQGIAIVTDRFFLWLFLFCLTIPLVSLIMFSAGFCC